MKVDTLKYMIEAANLLSLNIRFVHTSPKCGDILRRMLGLLKCPNILMCFDIKWIHLLIDTIFNIIAGNRSSIPIFVESEGPKYLFDILLNGIESFLRQALRNLDIIDVRKQNNLVNLIKYLFSLQPLPPAPGQLPLSKATGFHPRKSTFGASPALS